MPVPHSIHARFLRVHLLVGLVAVLVVTLVLGVTDYYRMRRLLVDDFVQTARSAGALYATGHIHHFSEAFAEHKGLELLCIYNAQGDIDESWTGASQALCPGLLSHPYLEIEGLHVRLAQSVTGTQGYVGMVYLEARLSPLADWLMAALLKLATLVLVAVCACWTSAYVGARTVARAIEAVQRQIECLKQNDIAFCPLSTLHATRETAALADSVLSLRSHLAQTMVSKETIANIRNWHWTILGGLLMQMRKKLQADSALVTALGDYELLTRMEHGELPSPHVVFEMPQLLDEALAAARRIHTQESRVTLSASLQPGMEKHWLGQSDMLGALLRHLLVIGLTRTRQGFVTLRLEAMGSTGTFHTHTLRLVYEDSGTVMQQWQLQHWLTATRDDAPPIAVPHDISWLLIGRLVKRLNGSITAQAGSQGGMILEAKLPFSQPLEPEKIKPDAPRLITLTTNILPLLLIVERGKEAVHGMAELFEDLAHVLIVETHAQAVSVSPGLPLSAILLNATLDDCSEDVTRRLRYFSENGLMAAMPLWLMADSLSYMEAQQWQQRGIAEVLTRPLARDIVKHLCRPLGTPDAQFYQQFDAQVREDLGEEILAMIPTMNVMLAGQVAKLVPIVEQFAQGASVPRIVEEAHAVKSAALTLGYFRLAALMDHIESAGITRIYERLPANWHVIADTLRTVRWN